MSKEFSNNGNSIGIEGIKVPESEVLKTDGLLRLENILGIYHKSVVSFVSTELSALAGTDLLSTADTTLSTISINYISSAFSLSVSFKGFGYIQLMVDKKGLTAFAKSNFKDFSFTSFTPVLSPESANLLSSKGISPYEFGKGLATRVDNFTNDFFSDPTNVDFIYLLSLKEMGTGLYKTLRSITSTLEYSIGGKLSSASTRFYNTRGSTAVRFKGIPKTVSLYKVANHLYMSYAFPTFASVEDFLFNYLGIYRGAKYYVLPYDGTNVSNRVAYIESQVPSYLSAWYKQW